MAGPVIAIIDDEPQLVDMFSMFLRIKGFEVRSSYTGEEGLTLVQVEKPDLLLLDLMLPDIDGYAICERLRAIPDSAALPILIVSARVDGESISRAMQAGASGYLTKPVKFPDLLVEMNRLLEARPAAAPPVEAPPPAAEPVPPAEVPPPAAEPAPPAEVQPPAAELAPPTSGPTSENTGNGPKDPPG